MKNFLLILCLIVLNACSLTERVDDVDPIYIVEDGTNMYYGTDLAFVYGEEIEVSSMTWTRSKEISSGTYIYTSTVSYTTDDDTTHDDTQVGGGSMTYYPEQQDPLDENPNIPRVTSSDDIILYMKVAEMSNGVALYTTSMSEESAISSTGYQLYTCYMTYFVEEYYYE